MPFGVWTRELGAQIPRSSARPDLPAVDINLIRIGQLQCGLWLPVLWQLVTVR